eukprot:Rmarinus@m.17867
MASRFTSLARVVGRRAFHSSRPVLAEADSNALRFSFVTPSQSIMKDAEVDNVILPGAAGYFGVYKDHGTTVSQLSPGVVQVDTGKEQDRWFVSGGYAYIHEDRTDVVVVEAVKVEDLDPQRVAAGLADADAAVKNAAGEEAQLEAAIQHECFQAMKNAVDGVGH